MRRVNYLPVRSLFLQALTVATICLTVSVSGQVQAHVLQSSNGVSAVLHIVPDDDPVAGVATVIGLEFNSTIPGFDLGNYTTDVTVKGESVDVTQPPVHVASDSDNLLYGTAQVTFPQPGTYTMTVHGVSNRAGEGFTIAYEIRAERPLAAEDKAGSTINSAGFDSIMVGAASLGLLGIIAQYQIRQGGRYDKNRAGGYSKK